MAVGLSSETIHATCIAIGDSAVLLSGPSGSGKSDLALRLIDRGAVLVSDDYTVVKRSGTALTARAPDTIKGKLEVRGVGIVPTETKQDVLIGCIIDLAEESERMPSEGRSRSVAGVPLPLFALKAFEASAPLKVELIIRQLIEQ